MMGGSGDASVVVVVVASFTHPHDSPVATHLPPSQLLHLHLPVIATRKPIRMFFFCMCVCIFYVLFLVKLDLSVM